MERYAETTVTTEYDSADSDASYPTDDLAGYHEHDYHGSRRRRPDVTRSGRKAFKEPSPHRRRSPRSKLRGRMHCGCGAEAVVELSVDDTLDSGSDNGRDSLPSWPFNLRDKKTLPGCGRTHAFQFEAPSARNLKIGH
ncbi:hypothetical protein N0V85_003613 [Neurospora sp. IMI 360204]|nr:hypothetical protein N0V85_003613 [Neurospora sp. IMI 360204]